MSNLALLTWALLHLGAGAASVPLCADGVHKKIPNFKRRMDLVIPDNKESEDDLLSGETLTAKITADGSPLTFRFVRYQGFGKPPRKTVIHLCGGPARCSQTMPSGIPGSYDVITMDPLGLGDNYQPAMTATMKSVDSQAAAVKAIVAKLQLKDYVINGRSIGTPTATAAAARIAADPALEQPKAVVLEGTLGPKSVPSRDYVRDSKRTWALLSAAERSDFTKRYTSYVKANPLDSDRALNMMFLLLRSGPQQMAQYIRQLNQLSAAQWTTSMDQIVGKAEGGGGGMQGVEDKGDAGESLYRALGCQTINHSQSAKEDEALFDKGLNIWFKGIDADTCPCRSLAKAYDPCEYQIKAPVLYLQGEYDPVASLAGAEAHARCQTSSSNKKFIVIKDYGHGITDVPTGGFSSCVNTIYDAASAGNLASLDPKRDWIRGCGSPAAPRVIRSGR